MLKLTRVYDGAESPLWVRASSVDAVMPYGEHSEIRVGSAAFVVRETPEQVAAWMIEAGL